MAKAQHGKTHHPKAPRAKAPDPKAGKPKAPRKLRIEREEGTGALGWGLAAGALALVGGAAALLRWRGQAITASKNTFAAMEAPEPASDVPAQTATTAVDGPLTGAVDDTSLDSLGTPTMAATPRVYTGSARPDMAIYSEPGNDERPAEQPDAARNARDEGERVGAMVDA